MTTTRPPRNPDPAATRTDTPIGLRRSARSEASSRLRLPHLSMRRLLLQFVAISVLGLLLLAAVTAIVARSVGEEHALDQAKEITWVFAAGVMEPNITPGVMSGDRRELDRLDGIVRRELLNGSMNRIKVWEGDRVIYSDDQRLIGMRFPLAADEAEVVETGETEAEVTDLSKPENQFEPRDVQLVEVYTRIQGPDGQPLLFEAYYTRQGVNESARELWLDFAPLTLGALVVLLLLQFPLAWGLAARLRRGQQERERLLRHAIDASDRERRRIAGDLHDGVVQDLSGVSFSLSAAGRRAAASGPAASPEELGQAASSVRGAIKALRSLIVEIYPPNLHEEGLENALNDLVAPLEARGMRTGVVAAAGVEPMADETRALLYRSAQEAVRNVASHADATQVEVRISRRGRFVTLEVEDDGRGFQARQIADQPPDGHVGLRVLADLVADIGGRVVLSSAPGAGTLVTVEVPA